MYLCIRNKKQNNLKRGGNPKQRLKNMKTKSIFLEFHGTIFKEVLTIWLKDHPRTMYWIDETVSPTLAMSESAWKRFCKESNYDFNEL